MKEVHKGEPDLPDLLELLGQPDQLELQDLRGPLEQLDLRVREALLDQKVQKVIRVIVGICHQLALLVTLS